MVCPSCGSKMIICDRALDPEGEATSVPALAWFWWCGCGNRLPGGAEEMVSEPGQARARWQRANARIRAVQYEKTLVLLDQAADPSTYQGMQYRIVSWQEEDGRLTAVLERLGRVENR